jgi:subtilisin family serine protease
MSCSTSSTLRKSPHRTQTGNLIFAVSKYQHGHGIHCAGTIFGRDVGGTRIGVAPGVKKALIGKVIGPGGGSSDSIADAINWAIEDGAHVISMSLGIDFPGFVKALEASGLPTEAAVTRALEGYRANVQLFERLASLGRTRGLFGQTTLIVPAAGNESRRTGTSAYEIAVAPPAVAEGVISVAALAESPRASPWHHSRTLSPMFLRRGWASFQLSLVAGSSP